MTVVTTSPTTAPLKVLVVDDEPLARHWLRMQLGKCTIPIEASEAPSAALAKVWLENHECDAILLDIHMPGLNGLDFAKYCQTLNPKPAIIFVTADSSHALQAFELAASDYLTKPVSLERLEQALHRIDTHVQLQKTTAFKPLLEEPKVLIDSTQLISQLPLSQILYFQAENKYVNVITARENYLIETSLNALEKQFQEHVIRIHRSYLVPKHAIAQLVRNTEEAPDSWMIQIRGLDKTIAVSRRQLPQVKEVLRAV